MPTISDAQIAETARSGGLPADKVAVAVAIALAESGGNTTAHNTLGLDNSYGLWQINMYGDMGPDRRRKLGIPNNDALFNPLTNARAMVMISQSGTKWTDWTTYTSGAYLRFMSRGNAVAGGSSGSLPPIPVPELSPQQSSQLSDITKFFQLLTDRNTWIRLGFWFAGGLLILIAVTKMTGDNRLSETTKTVGKAAIGLLPGGGTVTSVAKKVVK